jgi:hypothetical protein
MILRKNWKKKHHELKKEFIKFASEKNQEELISLVEKTAVKLFNFGDSFKLLSENNDTIGTFFTVTFQDELCCYIEIVDSDQSPKIDCENLEKIARSNLVKTIAQTDGTNWLVFVIDSSLVNYKKAGEFSLFDLGKESLENCEVVRLLKKESFGNLPITNLYNRRRWYVLSSNPKFGTDFMFLAKFCLYENGSESVYLPKLDVLICSDKSFDARNQVWNLIYKHVNEQFGEEYFPMQSYETIASRYETLPFKEIHKKITKVTSC